MATPVIGQVVDADGSLTNTGKKWMSAFEHIQRTLIVTDQAFLRIDYQRSHLQSNWRYAVKLTSIRYMAPAAFSSAFQADWPFGNTYYSFQTGGAMTPSAYDSGFVRLTADCRLFLLFKPTVSPSDLDSITVAQVDSDAAAVQKFHAFVSAHGAVAVALGFFNGISFVFTCAFDGTWGDATYINISP